MYFILIIDWIIAIGNLLNNKSIKTVDNFNSVYKLQQPITNIVFVPKPVLVNMNDAMNVIVNNTISCGSLNCSSSDSMVGTESVSKEKNLLLTLNNAVLYEYTKGHISNCFYYICVYQCVFV